MGMTQRINLMALSDATELTRAEDYGESDEEHEGLFCPSLQVPRELRVARERLAEVREGQRGHAQGLDDGKYLEDHSEVVGVASTTPLRQDGESEVGRGWFL